MILRGTVRRNDLRYLIQSSVSLDFVRYGSLSLVPTFSGAQDILSPTMSSFLFPGISSIGGMKSHLQFLLDNKEKQLQQVGTLGQRILSQQVLLDERVRELHKLEADLGDNQDLDSEIRERYRKLTEMVEVWDADNARLTQLFTPKVRLFSHLR